MVLGLFFAGLSLACAILVYAAPGAAKAAFGLLVHSDFSFTLKPFSIAGVLAGVVLWFVIGFVVGTAWSKLCDCYKK